jgi:PAS domain S-box/diguanylate cyclase (GGDEF) domain
MSRVEFKPPVRFLLRYSLTIVLVLEAFLLRQSLEMQFGISLPPYITFYPAVILISLFFGIVPGLLGVALSSLIVSYAVFIPTGSLKISGFGDIIGLVMFIVISVAICIMSERIRRDVQRVARLENAAKLQENRNLLLLFIEHSMTSVAMFDTEMHYLTASQEWCREYNLSRDNIIGRSHYDVFPEMEERWKAVHQRSLAGETVHCNEDQIIRSDGSVHWLRWEARPWRRYDGTIGGIVIFSDNITARKRAEDALRIERAKMDLALASTPDAIFIVDANGEIVDFNEAFAKFHRFASKEECPRKMSDLQEQFEISGEGRESLPVEQRPTQRAFRGEICVDVVLNICRRDTGESWMGSYNFGPMRDQDGNIIAAVVTVRDVTEQRRAIERLTESETRFRHLFEDNASIFILIDPASGRILDANSAATTFYGYTRDQLRSMTIAQLNRADETEIRPYLDHVADGNTQRFKRIHYLASGEGRDVEVLASPIEFDKQKVNFAVVRDVTEMRKAEQELRHREELYRTAFMTSLDAILITESATGKIMKTNVPLQAMLGYQEADLVGKSTLELNLWANPRDRRRMLDRFLKECEFRDFEFPFKKSDGEIRSGLMSASTIKIEDTLCIHAVLRDVTDAKLAAEKIKASEERYRIAFQTSIDAVAISRISDGIYLDVNQRFQEITGYGRGDVVGKTALEIGIWDDLKAREEFLNRLIRYSSCRDFQTKFRKKTGGDFWATVSATQFTINDQKCVLSVIRDISDARMAEEQIRKLAYFDPLTGLANRRLLLERLQPRLGITEALRRYRALLTIDLDDFRTLNDAMGQTAGDLVLREAGMRLTSIVQAPGIVARLGGDEFAVLLDDLGENSEEAAGRAGLVAEGIRHRVERLFQLQGRSWSLSCSIGISVFAGDDPNSYVSLQQSDIAMNQAKNAGRGSIRFFVPSLQAAVQARATLDEELRVGVQNNEFELFFQPQVERGSVVGAEALLRWNHPRRGLLAPDAFIRIAEETGVIYPLGDWILQTACSQIVAWSKNESTASLSLSVNICALEIRRSDFASKVLATIERTEADPTKLQLEITESTLMDDVEDTIAKMNVLKKHGLRFSIDDFGTGFSSLSYLKRFPLDELKIDSSFVRDILHDNSSRAIAQAVISLSKAMNLVVVAEGVEHEEQQVLLEQLGCKKHQGYLFGRPLPDHAFQTMLNERRSRATADRDRGSDTIRVSELN